MGRRKPRRDTDNETPPKDTQTKQSSENPSTSKEEKKTSERSPEPGDSGSKSPATSMTFSSPRKSLTPPSFKLFETSRTSSTVSRTTTEEQSGSCSESYHHLGHSRATSLKDGLKKAKNIATGFVKQLRARSKSPRPEDRKAYIFAPKSCALKDEEMKETFASIYDHFKRPELARKPKEGKAEDTRPPSGAEDRESEKEEVEVEEDSSAERAVVGDSGLSASSTSTDPMARLTPDSVRMRHSSKSPSKGSQKTPESHPEHDTSEVGAVHRPRKGAEETFQSPRKSTDEDSISSLTSSTPAMPLTNAEETIPEQASDSKQGEEVTEDSKPSQAPSKETIQPKRPATLAPQSSRFIEDSEQPSCSNWRLAVELNEYTFPSAVPSQSTSSTPSSETMDAIARMYEEYLEDVNCPLRNDRDEIIQLMQNFLAGKFPHEAVREGARWFCVGNYSIWMGIQDSCADYWFHCGLVRKKKNEGKPKKPKDYGKHLICCRAHSLEPGKTDSAPAERRSADKSKVDSLGSSELDGSETSDKNLNESAKTKASRAKPRKPEESETSSEKPSRPEGSSSSLETSWQTQSGESAPSAREQMSDFVQKFLAGEERPPLQPRVAYSFFYP